MNRIRCPFCDELVDRPRSGLTTHIVNRHFPTHCTVCDKTPNSHPTTETSPPYTMPCKGGMFQPGDVRR